MAPGSAVDYGCDYDCGCEERMYSGLMQDLLFLFLKSVVFIKLHTKIRGMQPVGYGLKNSKKNNFSISFRLRSAGFVFRRCPGWS